MNIFKWIVGRSHSAGAAMVLYKQGLRRVHKRDMPGAMEAFTSAIELPGCPEDVKAMALYNRALLFAGLDDPIKARSDLNAVLAMSSPLPSIKLAARRRLGRMQHQQDVGDAAHPHPRPAD